MTNVIPLFAALPKVEGDPRIVALHRVFGRNPFSIQEAADLLDVDYSQARRWLDLEPIFDARWRVSQFGAKYWLLPSPLSAHAVAHWRTIYTPLVQRLTKDVTSFSTQTFAKEAGIPYATANFILSLLVKDDMLTVTVNSESGAPYFALRKRRRVIRCG